ncbi:MAG: hypothetical protein FJ264_08795 [Planctomycetes bacterium]|nr:hypothetical protein [Planctomycetota bacterium]
MAKAKKNLNIQDVLLKMKECIDLLPGKEEQQRMVQAIHELIMKLESFKESISRVPDESEKNRVLQAIHTVSSFFDSVKNKPLLAEILFPKQKKARKTSVRPVNIDDLLKQLEELQSDKIMTELSKQKKNILLELSSRLNITANPKLTKDVLIDKIFKLGFANQRGYNLLGDR